jgi:SAM-dependent methyltransferase
VAALEICEMLAQIRVVFGSLDSPRLSPDDTHATTEAGSSGRVDLLAGKSQTRPLKGNMKKLLVIFSWLAVFILFRPELLAQIAPTTAPPQNRNEQTPPQAATKRPDVIFVATPQPAVEKMLEMAEVKKGDVLYDLGCGDGRIVVTAAKKYGVKAYGFDIDPKRVEESLANVRSNKVEHLVTIKQADIFTLDLSKADVVTLYLLPSLNVRLIPQLEKLKPGSRIVSHSFEMEGIKPVQVYRDNSTIYKWVTPLQREARGLTSGAR